MIVIVIMLMITIMIIITITKLEPSVIAQNHFTQVFAQRLLKEDTFYGGFRGVVMNHVSADQDMIFIEIVASCWSPLLCCLDLISRSLSYSSLWAACVGGKCGGLCEKVGAYASSWTICIIVGKVLVYRHHWDSDGRFARI